MNQFRKTLFIIISIVIVAAIISIIILFVRINSIFSDPVFRVISASRNTFTAYSAKIDAVLENEHTDEIKTITGQYEIDSDAKKLKAEFNIISKSLEDESKTNSRIDIQVNFTKNGGEIVYKQNDKAETIDISKENAEQFFVLFSETKDFDINHLKKDWHSFIEEAGLQDYINADEFGDSIAAVYNTLSSDESKRDILGLTTESTKDGDIISFALNPYLTANSILENIEPIFKNKDDYSLYKNWLEENKTTLDSLVIRLDATISNEGLLKELSANNLGVKLNVKISDITTNS